MNKFKKKLHQPSAANKNIRRKQKRSRVQQRYDKNLKPKWITARNSLMRLCKHLLDLFRLNKNICFYCSIYQYFEKCDVPSLKHKYWHCCSNNRIHEIILISKSDFDDLKALKNDKIKEIIRVFKIEIQTFFHNLMHEIKVFNNEITRIKTNKNFQKFIIFYNNVFSFCNELAIVNFKNSGWATFHCIKRVKYMLKSFIISKSELAKFCQIYQINSFQKTLKRQMNENIDGNILYREIFL